MIKIRCPIIVEGKYDKITLSNIVDTLIITTNGFSIFKNKEKRDLIRALAKKHGVIVLTDSDSAGRMIRSHIKQICPDGKIINVYIPKIKGKEKRKSVAGSEGLLGVEGMTTDTIIDALRKSGVTSENIVQRTEKLSKTDLYLLGLNGKENSSHLRDAVCHFFDIPTGFTANAFLDVVNTLFERQEFIEGVKKCLQETDKS
ncbi:MAG: DUF4093 domain-containing protein [Oscillospiraceae bacterium]|nr:DUF4093 domain-containing protein [Oscillospiraceae bacterium]